MSGPKCVSYEVVDAAELARRALAAAEARAQVREQAIRMLMSAAGPSVTAQVGAAPPRLPAQASLSELRAYTDKSESYERSLLLAMAEERTAVARAALKAQLAKFETRLDEGSFVRRRLETPTPSQESASDISNSRDARVGQRLEQALAAAAATGDPSLGTELAKLAAIVDSPDTTPATARSFLSEIEARVTAAVRRHQREQALAQRRRDVRDEFGDLTVGEPLEVETAHGLLDRALEASDERALNHLIQELRELRNRRKADADRRFAITQAMAVLRDLGYQVDQEHPSTTNEATQLTATTDRWPRHGLRLVFRADKASIHTAPVALTTTDARDDVAFEEASCTDIDRLRSELEHRGLPNEMTHHVPAGRLAVVREHANPDQAGRTRTTVKPREQSR